MVYASVTAIEYYTPKAVETNNDIVKEFPDWTIEKIEEKTGIKQRFLSSKNETAADLAYQAAIKLFDSSAFPVSEVDYIILCTQSPDYYLPSTACILQDRLGISTSAGAFDFNLGCSGYVYGLSLSKALIESGQANNILFLTSETYSKYINPEDRSVRTIFGDAAAASLIQKKEQLELGILPAVVGTDGSGYQNLIVRNGAARMPRSGDVTDDFLFMDGSEVFNFTLASVPRLVESCLKKSGCEKEKIDYYIFHQANAYMLEHLRKKIRIPREKFCVEMSEVGNTVSSTIPIAMKRAIDKGKLLPGQKVMLVGFGVGYSWGAVILEVDPVLFSKLK